MSQTCDDVSHIKKSASKALEFFNHTQQQLAWLILGQRNLK
jgi:hypothetical protein